jgi:hypothetical protein
MQGGLRGAHKTLLTPATAANILHTTGSPQQDEPGRPATQHIGSRPDLKDAFQQLGLAPMKIKEQKEHKEIIKEKDIKELKDHKEHFKDQKDKENIKENKELKDYLKEKDKDKEFKEKDAKDLKDIRERVKVVEVRPTALPASADFETRLTELEGAVAALAHFIAPEERPDLQTSALAAEADLLALSQELQKQSADAKTAKDTKDIEKMREG